MVLFPLNSLLWLFSAFCMKPTGDLHCQNIIERKKRKKTIHFSHTLEIFHNKKNKKYSIEPK